MGNEPDMSEPLKGTASKTGEKRPKEQSNSFLSAFVSKDPGSLSMYLLNMAADKSADYCCFRRSYVVSLFLEEPPINVQLLPCSLRAL